MNEPLHLPTRAGRAASYLFLLSALVGLSPGAALGQDGGGSVEVSSLQFSLGVITIPGYSVYDGLVNLGHAGESFTGQYRERPELSMGMEATAAWTSDALGDVSVSAFGSAGDSQADFAGIGGAESRSRSITTLGLDVGLRPALAEGSWGSFRVPFGPSVLWQSMDLSDGHRDIYGDPDALGPAPEVAWSNRSWISFGGYGGIAFDASLSRSIGFDVKALGRFMFADNGAWSGQEEEDIVESTGNAVNISYEKLVVFFVTTEVGLTWRP